MRAIATIKEAELKRFWQDLSDSLLGFCKALRDRCRLELESDAEDLRQHGMIAARKFVIEFLQERSSSEMTMEQLVKEAGPYVRTSIHNKFITEVRRAAHRNAFRDAQSQVPEEVLGSSWMRPPPEPTPEEIALAADLARRMADASKSAKNKAIANAAFCAAIDGRDPPTGKDVIAAAKVESRDLADFRRMVGTKLRIGPRFTG